MEAVWVKKIFALAVLLLAFSCGAALAAVTQQGNFSAELDKLFKVSDAKIDMFMAAAGWKVNPDMGVAADYVGEQLGLKADLPGLAITNQDMSRWFRVIFNMDKTKIRAISWGMTAQ